jgi:signal transduction histidine kinase
MNIALDSQLSLFQYLDQRDSRRLMANYRGSLTTISHEIEDSIVNTGAPARIFAGFQRMRYFLPQVDRYRRLARYAEHIWVFGIPDVTLPPINNVTYVTLTETDRLAQEWFLVADSPDYFSALVAHDLSGFGVPQHKRLFRGLWTFDLELVTKLRDVLSMAVGAPPPVYDSRPRDYARQLGQVSRTVENLIQDLENSNSGLRQANTLRRDLTDMIVHDLRNPLTAVINYLDLIERAYSRKDEPAMKSFIESARESSQDLVRLISDMLDISRMESGEFRLEQLPVSVEKLFDLVCKRFEGAAELDSKKITSSAPPGLGIYGDEEILVRVLSNLVGNAFKYTRRNMGTIALEARLDGDDQYVLVSVQDNGQGIPKELQTRIFEKFGQAKGHERRGFGLGLPFCKMSIEAQGGTLWVESEEGKGARFIFRMRAAPL